MKLAPGLHRIGNDLVAAYLVTSSDDGGADLNAGISNDDPRGITVIDAGLAGQWRDLTRELKAMGRSVSDIRALVLTHGDSDHVGFAERLRRDHGVPVFVHGADAARARGETSTSPTWGKLRLGPLVRFIAYTLAKGGMRTTYLTSVTEVVDGQVLDAPGSPRIISMPGHSPGSIAIHVPSVDAVFVGDALTTRHVLTGKRGPQPAPFTDEPDEALGSLERLRETHATWVLPGHGPAWSRGVEAAIDAVRASATI